MVTSPLIPLPRLRSGLIMPFLFNRGDVRILYHFPTAEKILRKKITGTKVFIRLLQGEWWGSTMSITWYVRDATNNLRKNNCVGAQNIARNLDSKASGENVIGRGLVPTAVNTAEQKMVATAQLLIQQSTEKASA